MSEIERLIEKMELLDCFGLALVNLLLSGLARGDTHIVRGVEMLRDLSERRVVYMELDPSEDLFRSLALCAPHDEAMTMLRLLQVAVVERGDAAMLGVLEWIMRLRTAH